MKQIHNLCVVRFALPRCFALVPLLALGLQAQPELDRCSALTRVSIPDVEITSATLTPAGPAGRGGGTVPDHCLVRGAIDKRVGFGGKPFAIGFEMRLPVKWERRFLFQGGGGMDGTVRPALGAASGANTNPALARAFAVVSTDAGHMGAPPMPEADASFARDQQARIDNAYRSIERVTQVSKQIAMQYYGEPWRHAYFDGCSNGGRQALMAAQRYPRDFDGIVSGAPAYRVTHAAIGSAWETQAFLSVAPKDDVGRPILSRAFSEGDLKLVAEGVLKQCDALDGLTDRLVMNTRACRFDPKPLMCAGAKQPGCLIRDQVAALEKVMGGPKNSRGEAIYSDWPWDPGIASPAWRALKLGTSPTPQANSIDVLLMLSGLKGYFMYPYDESFDPLRFDFDKDTPRVNDTAALQDPTSTHLSTFIDHGGKLLLYHGMGDPFFSALDTQRYYERLANDNGGLEKTKSFALYFPVPGMNHCAGGPALDNFDALDAIVQWVEQGKAPDSILATGAQFPGVSRPLCAWPKHAEYNGTGPRDAAASFSCKE
jgi:feruloyl esterase